MNNMKEEVKKKVADVMLAIPKQLIPTLISRLGNVNDTEQAVAEINAFVSIIMALYSDIIMSMFTANDPEFTIEVFMKEIVEELRNRGESVEVQHIPSDKSLH